MKVRMREMRETDGALKRSLHLWLLRVAVNVLFSTCFMTCEPIALLSSFPTHQRTFKSQTCIQTTAPAIVKAFSESNQSHVIYPSWAPPLRASSLCQTSSNQHLQDRIKASPARHRYHHFPPICSENVSITSFIPKASPINHPVNRHTSHAMKKRTKTLPPSLLLQEVLKRYTTKSPSTSHPSMKV